LCLPFFAFELLTLNGKIVLILSGCFSVSNFVAVLLFISKWMVTSDPENKSSSSCLLLMQLCSWDKHFRYLRSLNNLLSFLINEDYLCSPWDPLKEIHMIMLQTAVLTLPLAPWWSQSLSSNDRSVTVSKFYRDGWTFKYTRLSSFSIFSCDW